VDAEPLSSPPEVDLVLYEAGGRLLGSDASQVVRVACRSSETVSVERLGAASSGRRALIVREAACPKPPCGLGAAAAAPWPIRAIQVPIDRLVGLERTSACSLRRLPEFAAGLVDAAVVGFLLRDGALVPLIDLEVLVEASSAS
jgi:hypothetical protein